MKCDETVVQFLKTGGLICKENQFAGGYLEIYPTIYFDIHYIFEQVIQSVVPELFYYFQRTISESFASILFWHLIINTSPD